jgi:predicted DNA-binding transcriptional regulator
MEIAEGRQSIAIRWIMEFVSNEREYNTRVHQLFQRGLLARVLGEISEVNYHIYEIV